MTKYFVNFRKWLLFENTISQTLKTKYKPDIVQASIQGSLKNLKTRPWTRTIPEDKLLWLAKWSAYEWLLSIEKGKRINYQNIFANYDNPKLDMSYLLQQSNEGAFNHWLLAGDEDYIAAMYTENPNILKSKFNNPDYKKYDLQKDSKKWHDSLINKRQPGGKGRIILTLPKGWKWLSLDRASCSDEAEAGGHCGNSGFKDGDNILSLRDAKNYVHATFIVNDHMLGEAKGYGNEKPTKQYHPAIVALLLEKDIIEFIKGGGYLPEKNFSFEDLTKTEQEKVLKVKPYINNFFEYLKSLKDMKSALNKLNTMYSYEFLKINFSNKFATIAEWDDIDDMIRWLDEKTYSQLSNLPNFDDYDISYYPDDNDALSTYQYYANKDNEKKLEDIMKEKKIEEMEEDGEIMSALRSAAMTGYEVGANNDAWKSVVNFFNGAESNGFNIIKMSNHSWEMRISFDDLKNKSEELSDDLRDARFEYEPPYNGYSGFDEDAYNEQLSNLLDELK